MNVKAEKMNAFLKEQWINFLKVNNAADDVLKEAVDTFASGKYASLPMLLAVKGNVTVLDLFFSEVSNNEQNELNPVGYQAGINVYQQNLPFWMVIDDSIFVMFQIRIANGVVNEKNKKAVLELLNSKNETYKVFKYYVDSSNSIMIESCIPCTDDVFSPAVVNSVVMVVLEQLLDDYKELMNTVWINK